LLAGLAAAASCVWSARSLHASAADPAPPAAATAAPAASTASAPATPDPAAAQQLALAFVDDVLHDRWDDAFRKMEARYRVGAAPQGLKQGIGMMTDFYGKPLAFHYKTRVDARWQYPDGEVKPLSKYWFTAPTPKIAQGVFAAVSVVPDGDHLGVAQFSLLTYPEEPPDFLK
jgi:hypothetical protein